MLKRNLTYFLFLFITNTALCQEEAVTNSGKTVLLFADSTWRLKPEPAAMLAVNDDSSMVQRDTLSPPPAQTKVKKEFKDTSTGFKGFLKPDLHLPPLPPESEGVYAFRVKVNKDGIVKEVITTQHGPNGQAEIMMRNTIIKLRYRWDNTPIPPLTEGIIKIEVGSAQE